jgi:hypothetical protein
MFDGNTIVDEGTRVGRIRAMPFLHNQLIRVQGIVDTLGLNIICKTVKRQKVGIAGGVADTVANIGWHLVAAVFTIVTGSARASAGGRASTVSRATLRAAGVTLEDGEGAGCTSPSFLALASVGPNANALGSAPIRAEASDVFAVLTLDTGIGT